MNHAYMRTFQSKHIVIFDTLIKQSEPQEVEAVLGKYHKKTDYLGQYF
jgi:hypothetical protein